MGTEGRTVRRFFQVTPVVLLIIVFTAFVTYVFYNLHLFIPRAPRGGLECDYFRTEKPSLASYLENRSQLFDDESPPQRCWAIKKKHYFPIEVPDSLEVHHHMYFVRVVSQNYEFLEEVLTMMFSPLHFYCFAIDAAATPQFELKIRSLGACVFHLIVPPGRYDSRDPMGEFAAHKACFDQLTAYEWEHAVINQENEIPVQSMQTLTTHVMRLGDSSLIGKDTINEEQVRLLVESGKNAGSSTEEEQVILNATASWFHGRRDPLILSRAFQSTYYEYIMHQLNRSPSLFSAPPQMSNTVPVHCASASTDRDGNCILGMENYNYAMRSKRLFVRADPQFDYGFVECIHKAVFERTYKDVLALPN